MNNWIERHPTLTETILYLLLFALAALLSLAVPAGELSTRQLGGP
jgi:hypothetical protein